MGGSSSRRRAETRGREGSIRAFGVGERRANWGGVVEGREEKLEGLRERGGNHWRREEGGIILGTWARAPQVQFCPSPISSPQMRTHRQNKGKNQMHIYLAQDVDTEGAGERIFGEETRRCRGEVHGDSGGCVGVGLLDSRNWRPESLDLGRRWVFGGSSLPRPGERQQDAAAPASGWVGRLIPGIAPSSARLGSPLPPPGPQAPTLRQGQQWRCPEAGVTRHHLQGLERERGREREQERMRTSLGQRLEVWKQPPPQSQ